MSPAQDSGRAGSDTNRVENINTSQRVQRAQIRSEGQEVGRGLTINIRDEAVIDRLSIGKSQDRKYEESE